MAEFDEFAKALALAQIPNQDGTLKLAYITFDGDEALKPIDSPERNYRIRMQYAFPAGLLHADVEPVGVLRYVNVDVDNTLNGRSSPNVLDGNIVVKYRRAVALTVQLSSATRVQIGSKFVTFVLVLKSEGVKSSGPIWVAQEFLSETVPK